MYEYPSILEPICESHELVFSGASTNDGSTTKDPFHEQQHGHLDGQEEREEREGKEGEKNGGEEDISIVRHNDHVRIPPMSDAHTTFYFNSTAKHARSSSKSTQASPTTPPSSLHSSPPLPQPHPPTFSKTTLHPQKKKKR